MTSRSYFGEMNSTLGSVVPLAMFLYKNIYKITNFSKYPPRKWSMVNRKGTSFVDGLFRIVPLIIVIVIMTKIM